MVSDATTADPVPTPHCMWCSAELPSDSEQTCPTCGAVLVGDADSPVPGVTAIDADAIVRNARAVGTKPRSRLMSWISGEYHDAEDHKAPPGSLSPPPFEVRREILRLELEAEVANLQAEADAIAAEAAVESGVPIDIGRVSTPDIAADAPADTEPDAPPDTDADAPPDAPVDATSEDKPTS